MIQEQKIYKIINSRGLYLDYKGFVNQNNPELVKYFITMSKNKKGHFYYLLFQRPHLYFDNIIICLVQDIQTKQVFVIEKSSLKEETSA